MEDWMAETNRGCQKAGVEFQSVKDSDEVLCKTGFVDIEAKERTWSLAHNGSTNKKDDPDALLINIEGSVRSPCTIPILENH